MDELRKKSDKELKKIEDEIERIYKDAEDDLKNKWNKYMSRAEKRVEGAEKALQDAIKTGDADAISAARAALTQKKQAVFFRDKQFSEMVDAVTDRIANVNQLAADYVNGQMPAMYRYNYNGSLREVQRDAEASGISGIAFNMIDDATVARMQKQGEVTLPKRKIDVPKDKQWNKKAINAQMMQGIIQGESIPQMSKRLREVTDMNKTSSIRNARTMTTEAENGGRLDSMKEAEDMGLEYEKTWVSTHDERTRLSHALMDGETVGLDEPFSNGLMYPADPSGAPEEVYNCRCSLVRKLVGFKGKHIDAAGYEPTYFADAQQAAAENPPTETELHEPVEEFVPYMENVPDFHGKENVSETLRNMEREEAEVWNNYMRGLNYEIVSSEDNDTEFFTVGTKDVKLFNDSTEDTFFHETAHGIDNGAINGTIEISGSRKVIGSDEWREAPTFSDTISSASEAAQAIYDLNENAWEEDKTAFMQWAKMKDEEDFESLIHAVRNFEKEYGDAAGGVLSDMIDAQTFGKYPMNFVSGGHGADYWQKNANRTTREAWAEISSLKAAGNQKAIDALAEILPNRVKSEETIYDIVFKGGAAYEHEESTTSNTRISKTVWRFGKA